MSALFQVLDLFGLPSAGIFLETTAGLTGYVYVSGKTLVHAEAGPLRGLKAFWRLLSWTEGSFRIERCSPAQAPAKGEGLQSCLIEGLARLDEARRLRARVADGGDRLEITDEPRLLSRRLTRKSRFVLALVEINHSLDLVLDLSPFADLETLRLMADLLGQGVIVHDARASGSAVA